MVRTVRRIRGLDDAVHAHNFVSGARTDEIEKAMEGMTHSELLDMAMASIVQQMGSAAIGIRDALAHSSETMVKALAKANKYREESAAQAKSLARLQVESAAREEGLASRLREMESRASAAEARAELVSEKLKGALERASAAEGAAEAGRAAAEEVCAAKERAVAAEKAAAEAIAEKAGAVAYADEANARAGEAEERAREAEARAKEAEDKARQAEAGAERAVADYKASDEFKQEVIEGCLDAFAKGFEVCKARISAALQIDIAELEDIQPGGYDEEPAEEQDGGEPAPGEHSGEPAPGEP